MIKLLFLSFILLSTILFLLKQSSNIDTLSHKSTDFIIKIDNIENRTYYTVQKFGFTIQRVRLGANFAGNSSTTEIDNGFILHGLNQNIEFRTIENSDDFTLVRVSSVLQNTQFDNHCVDLAAGVFWFGGPELYHQIWPIEKVRLENFSYIPKQRTNSVGIAERYWLNSNGGFIYIDERVPLFLNQNVNGSTLCFIVKNEQPYNTRRETINFKYHLGFAKNAKGAQRKAIELFLKKPKKVADRRMVEFPIWSTWARYRKDIDENKVMAFADEIEQYGFNNSQLEIDDDWEHCYGSLTFSEKKFPNSRQLIDHLKIRGFRVTVWVHPFINEGCDPWYSEAKENRYFVMNYEGNSSTTWWNMVDNKTAGHIDFTNPKAAKWFQNRLKSLQKETGVDSFKFDAGETDWLPPDSKLNAAIDDHPVAMTKAYVRTASAFGSFIEVRTGQGTQDLPNFIRFIDKDSKWTSDNGLPTLITTLLQMNLVGYGFILPDMIGGNGYSSAPSAELFIRWLQANTFMPTLQYSYVPWNYSKRSIEICRKFTNLHAKYTDEIMEAFENAVKYGEPVNPPIWWLDPNDQVALGISDEFLLGKRILAAPVINKQRDFRHIYLPFGKWFDPNRNRTYEGPIWLKKYRAPIDTLPYFILT